MKKTPTKTILIGLILLLSACQSNTNQPAAVQVPNTQRAVATVAPLATRAIVTSESVTADGAMALSVPEVALSFDVSSKVVAVNVAAGQAVKKGALLATVDDTALQDAVVDAQLALKQITATIALQNAPATKESLASAQAALNSAYASYNTTKAGNTQSAIDAAKVNVDTAWLSYLNAQVSRDSACGGKDGLKDFHCKAQEASYGNAYESWAAAKASYEALLQPVSQNSLTQAYASVISAKAKLDALKNGVTAEQSKVDQEQINQAIAAVALAQSNLAKTKLVSPCDCTVETVDVAVGVVPPGTAFTLVNLASLQFKTTNLTERDVARIRVGAAVSLRLKAYTDVFTGKVKTILAQSSGTQSGVALYTVLIDVDPGQAQILPGMTGQAEIALSGG